MDQLKKISRSVRITHAGSAAMNHVFAAVVKWVELPSSCVVLGSWSIYFFGCCLVNSCGGLIR